MDYATHYQRVLDHYVRLGALDAWRNYVWAQIERMAADCPELYRDLPAQVTQRINEAKNDHGKAAKRPGSVPNFRL